MQKLPSEIAAEYGVDRTTIIEHCRLNHIAHERGERQAYLVDERDFKRWFKSEYRFRNRTGRAGRRWHKEELSLLAKGKIPTGRTSLAVRLKRFHSKPA